MAVPPRRYTQREIDDLIGRNSMCSTVTESRISSLRSTRTGTEPSAWSAGPSGYGLRSIVRAEISRRIWKSANRESGITPSMPSRICRSTMTTGQSLSAIDPISTDFAVVRWAGRALFPVPTKSSPTPVECPDFRAAPRSKTRFWAPLSSSKRSGGPPSTRALRVTPITPVCGLAKDNKVSRYAW